MFASQLSKLGIVGACAFALSISACDTSTVSPDPETAPALMSSDAFSMDGDTFPSESLLPGGETSTVEGTNHTRAYVTVLLVNAAVGIHLILPSALTSSASQDTPRVENGTWIWENTTTVFGSVIDLRLEGTPADSEVDWEMYMTTSNYGGQAYNDFVLYTATTQIGGGMSNWSLFYDIDGQGRTRVLDADYLLTGARHELTFSVPETNPNEDARGDAVYYMAEGNDRVFDQMVGVGQNRLIEWDAVTKVGSITAFDFNNGEQACWDSNLDNVSCTPAAL